MEMVPVKIVFEGAADMLSAYLVNQDNPAAVSAVRKLCQQSKPGAMIMLSADEFEAITDPREFVKAPI